MKAFNPFKYILCLVCAVTLSVAAFAQPLDEEDPVNVPIDGGLSLLLAAGVAYGARKGYVELKKKKENDLEK